MSHNTLASKDLLPEEALFAGDFLKGGFLKGMSVDNSRRDVCNRGPDPVTGLDGASSHAHDATTHRQRFRRLLRAIW
jgi:hypothetical protein